MSILLGSIFICHFAVQEGIALRPHADHAYKNAANLYERICGAKKYVVLLSGKWCPRRDSNPHTLRHMDLNHARLPIPPRGHYRYIC
jgi:hypothetical protein